MKHIAGKGVSGGVAIGRLRFFLKNTAEIERRTIDCPAAEYDRVIRAKDEAVAQLGELHDKVLREIGEKEAALFEIHQMMLEDEDFLDAVKARIEEQKINAECAVAEARDEFAAMFAEMDDPYMQARAPDVHDVSGRLLACLGGYCDVGAKFDEPVILAARDLSPSETVQLDKSMILAFATAGGTGNSHTAILARTMGLPAVIQGGEGLDESLDGRLAIVDGATGDIHIDPDEDTLAAYMKKLAEEAERRRRLDDLRGLPNVTRDGREIKIFANIGGVGELEAVKQNDAGGVGLFRSEFLYLEGDDYPDEEKQFAAYKAVVQGLDGKQVVIRTLDIGADKQIGYFDLPKEENPALGVRGIRLCLTRQDIFKTQLRAIFRAAAFGNVAVMFPMIASVWEVREAKRLIDDAKAELAAEGKAVGDGVEIGVMIETPAAALISDRLAAEVDFFSIGTNDLTQYTLAVDRQSHGIDRFCDPHHEAVLRLIRMVADNAHKYGKWVGICGELAGDPELTEDFLRMGIDELSVSPPQVLELRQRVRELYIPV